jgi:hypothetical protein
MLSSAKCVVIALSFLSAAGLTSVALAAGHGASPLPEIARNRQTPPSAAVAHTVKSVYETWNENIFSNLPAGTYTPIDALTKIKCGPAAGCTVIAEINAQVLALADGTQWAVCTQVDGNYANNGCYSQGTTNIADGYKKGNDRENWQITQGAHTVQTFIYTTNAMTLSAYQNDYVVVTP